MNLCKLFFFSTLLVLFVLIFGKPSVERFLNEEVTTAVSSEEVEEGNDMPAITLCPINSSTMTGWKDARVDIASHGYMHFLERECNSTEASKIYDCIDKKTFTEEESFLNTTFKVKETMSGFRNHKNSTDWVQDLTTTLLGNCFTLDEEHPPFDSIKVLLNKNMKYYFLIHDRDFFVSNVNPLALAKELYTLDGRFHLFTPFTISQSLKHIHSQREQARGNSLSHNKNIGICSFVSDLKDIKKNNFDFTFLFATYKK